jgi:hypothetical protein
MNADRQDLVDLLRARGEHDQALRAACSLPRQIDTVEDAGLLSTLDIHTATLEMSVVRD